MKSFQPTKILARVAAEDFIGRDDELSGLLNHAAGENEPRGILLLSAPAAGASELLRQTFDRLFTAQTEIIPFYFSFAGGDKNAKQTAVRFLQTFLQQTVAFRRQDARLLSIAPDVCEISELAAPPDAEWIGQLIKTCRIDSDLSDEVSFVRTALSAPLRAAARGARVLVMLDDVNRAGNFSGDDGANRLITELAEIYSRAETPFVFAGRRRFVLKAFGKANHSSRTEKVIRLGALTDPAAEKLVEKLAINFAVEINEQTRDLIVRQFRGNPGFITELFRAAGASRSDLNSFYQVQRVATDAICGGGFGQYYDSLFDEIAPSLRTQKQIIRLLRETAAHESQKTPLEYWKQRVKLSPAEVERTIRLLHIHEIARFDGGKIEAETGANTILADYIEARGRMESSGETRAAIVGDVLANALKRAPQIMTRFYRRLSSLNLKELLAVFDCQEIPAAFFDYAAFREKYRGAEDAEILAGFDAETDKITLPQIIYAADTMAFYRPISQFVDVAQRSAVALGFEAADYRRENEIVWIAAQIDSKLEASRELTEFWCDRLEAVAMISDFPRYRLWLITPEGFSDDALEVLRRRGAFGSSRKQANLLAARLGAKNVAGERAAIDEYEIIIPMGDETEMIAVRAVEEIARRHGFKPAAVNQIKTALVEACINATEHSHSPDRKIYQKIKVEEDKMIITIINRGVKISPEKTTADSSGDVSNETRRGWGLNLMRRLMDEVNFEQTDDGTRISLVKYL